jgi:hypothetical protein
MSPTAEEISHLPYLSRFLANYSINQCGLTREILGFLHRLMDGQESFRKQIEAKEESMYDMMLD